MRSFILCFLLIFILVSCKNEAKNSSEPEKNPIENIETNEDAQENQVPNSNENDHTSEEKTTSATNANGTYVKVDEDDADCSCYCIEIATTGESQLCLKDEEMYINARFANENGSIQVYFVNEATENTKNDLPWNKFDTNIPVAEITFSEEGMSLDWKGFSIDGDLAVDYAIYGKKTLEGNYKKQ